MAAAIDTYALRPVLNYGLDDPMVSGTVVTPSDTVDLPNVSRMIYVGGTGTLTVNLLNGTNDGGTASVLLSAIPAGTILKIRATRVLATGTSATLIVAFW